MRFGPLFEPGNMFWMACTRKCHAGGGASWFSSLSLALPLRDDKPVRSLDVDDNVWEALADVLAG